MTAPVPACPIERLLAISDLAGGELGEWLAARVLEHVRTGERLDHLLEVAGDLGRGARFNYLRHRRDAHLRAALAGLNGDFKALADAVKTYQTRLPRHVRDQAIPPAGWQEWRAEIHLAAQAGLALPSTARGLEKALGEDWNGTPHVPFRKAA